MRRNKCRRLAGMQRHSSEVLSCAMDQFGVHIWWSGAAYGPFLRLMFLNE